MPRTDNTVDVDRSEPDEDAIEVRSPARMDRKSMRLGFRRHRRERLYSTERESKSGR
jgi:hypothetical protein